MDTRIIHFIAALRASGVRVSLAESQDAMHAADHIGVYDREMFRLSLKATLVKEAHDGPAFDRLFPLFFGSNQPPMLDGLAEELGLTPEDIQATFLPAHLFQEVIQPQDIADAVLWLVSDQARFVTGAAIPVDAGWLTK